MIEQSVWREGLPDPDYERLENKVHNIIVHHSAGSNIDTNYTGIVRNIYIYHTEIRGWSDIGYNYLIAADGTVFKGRDPANLEQDNVRGAHFCASNSGTMGICIMGTYTDILPTSESRVSLISLVNWKLGKDSLNPMGTYPHVLNATLPVIAGHRDGCSTECPGELLYHLLDSVRLDVKDAFQACNYTVKPLEMGLKERTSSGLILCYTAKSISIRCNEGQIHQFQLFNLLGKEVHCLYQQVSPDEIVLFKDSLAAGIYLVKIFHKGSTYTDKIMHF